MMINKVTCNSTSFKASVRIEKANNQHRKYLYNEVLDTVNNNRIPAVFDRDGITLNNITKKITKTLNKLKINYKKIENK